MSLSLTAFRKEYSNDKDISNKSYESFVLNLFFTA